jgi:hypothetical protein
LLYLLIRFDHLVSHFHQQIEGHTRLIDRRHDLRDVVRLTRQQPLNPLVRLCLQAVDFV